MDKRIAELGAVYIVDDDPSIRTALSAVLSRAGFKIVQFGNGADFLAVARDEQPACVLLDIQLPGRSGIDILKELRVIAYSAPILMISGKGDIAMAVESMKNGAMDFIEKPFRASALVNQVIDAIATFSRRKSSASRVDIASLYFPGREPLTARECEVLASFIDGATSKEAGRTLGLSPRTIEDHRARIMNKLEAKNSIDLVRIVLTEGRQF